MLSSFQIILSLLIAISAFAAIYFHQIKRFTIFKWLKPTTTILIMTLAFGIYLNRGSTYSLIITCSLIFALIGDVFLIQFKHLLKGILFFSFAHFGFALAFVNIKGFQVHWWILIIILLANLSYLIFLRRKLKKFLIPIAIYMLIISIMNWQALGLYMVDQKHSFLMIALSSLLFTFSDSVIAFNLFYKNFRLSEPIILSSYWIAIYAFTLAGIFV